MKRKYTLILLSLMMALLISSQALAQEMTGEYVVDTTIQLNGASATVDGAGVTVDESTILIDSAGIYSLSGSLTDGQLIVDTDDEEQVTLVLNCVDLRSSTSAPIYIKNAEIAAIVLEDGTENYVSDATSYVYENADDDEPNAAVFSDDDLVISGTGSLTVVANFNDGISSKDSLTINEATLTVTSVDDGIRGKDSLTINDVNITLDVQGDGLKSDNEDDETVGWMTINSGTFNINAGGDAIQAVNILTINGGTFDIVTAGGSNQVMSEDLSAKGVKSDVQVVINDGNFTLNTADDAVHSNDAVVINGGTFTIATADDGMHADNTLDVNGGVINITQSYEGLESGVLTINAGDMSIVASDDGLNVAGGNDGSGMMGMGGPGGGGRGAPPQDQFTVTDSTYLMYINGGTIVVNAEGDGLDANGSIVMTGGTVIVNGPQGNRDGAIDYDGGFEISGGYVIAAGSAGMAQAPGNTSSQYSIAINFNTSLSAGTLVHIQNSAGEDILTFAPEKNFQSLVVSSPELVSGETYTIFTGGSSDGTVTNGVYEGGAYSDGTEYGTLTLTDVVTWLGSAGGFGRR